MLEIDGSEKSGSGTILRLSVALSTILKEDLHIYNIRKKRKTSGLRPQHLEAVITAAKLCDAEVRGAKVGSEEIWFKPSEIVGGKIEAQIGTAGSIPMLLLTILPICAFAKSDVKLRISKGGTDVKHAPTINYIRYILLPTLEKMGLSSYLEVHSFGYYPVGMGEVTLSISPCKKFEPLKILEFGELQDIGGLSVCTFLKERKVAERQAIAAEKYLKDLGFNAKIDLLYDTSNPHQKGSSLTLWAKTNKGVILGADSIGELQKRSEVVGIEAATNLADELKLQSTVDIHLADILIPYFGLARKSSMYFTRSLSDHLKTNIWLTEKILGIKFDIEKDNNLFSVTRV